MIKTRKLLMLAWSPEAKLQEKLRRMGLETFVKIRLRKGGDYEVTLSLTLRDDDEKNGDEACEDDDEPGGITTKMEISGREPPDADAVDKTWRSLAKTCSTYLSFRTLQKVWD